MPSLLPTEFHATIDWLGCLPSRREALAPQAAEALVLTYAGIAGDDHGGETMPACSRTVAQHPKGTEIRNVRQLSIVSTEDLAAIAAAMGLPRLEPAWIGASLALSGILDFSHVPPGARLQGKDCVTLVIDMENRPCHLPAPVIDAALGQSGIGGRFKAAAEGRRGVTAWVQRPGRIALGESLRLHIPDQPAWAGLDARRPATSLSA